MSTIQPIKVKPRRRRLLHLVTWGQVWQAPSAWAQALWQLGREHPWTMATVAGILTGLAVIDILMWIF